MNGPRPSAPPSDPLAWLGEPGTAIAELAFGRAPAAAEGGLVTTRHLALLPVDSLELDLDDPLQRQFGDYELLELLGEGGMGVVYRARQASLDREVAVKLLAAGPWASREFVERFQREAQNAARMQHPNIVAIYEVGSAEELHFFSMRLVRGESLAAAIRRQGPFPALRAAALMRVVAEALAYAHSLGVLHLDLKPANILLDENGGPHVADFGLARRLDSTLALDNEEVSGTPAYMAPEQALARVQKITPCTDIWGLGAILYELVTGELPFRGQDAQATLKLVIESGVRRPRSLVPDLPLDLEAIILTCMAKDPAERYASARALADDLGRFSERRAVRVRPLNASERVARWVRREPRLATASILIVLALLVGLAATTRQWQRAERNAGRAEAARQLLVGVFEHASPDGNRGKAFTAHQLLEKGETLISTHANEDPAIQADLTGLIGGLYWDIGDYARADKLLTSAARSNGLADVPAEVKARNLVRLAKVHVEKNEYDAAVAEARQALAWAQVAGASASAEASEARRTIADALTGSGRAKEAEPLLRQALEIDSAQSGDAGAAAADDRLLLGYALLELSRLDESVAMSRLAIDSEIRIHGRENSNVSYAMGNLATALRNQGKFVDAEQVLREALGIMEAMHGPDDRETLAARSNLWLTLESQGRYAEALDGRLAMLDAQKRLSADRPEILAYAYKNMAGDYLGLGRFAEAEASAREAIAAWSRIQGADDEWHSVAARDALATALQWQGKYVEAETTLRSTIAIQRKREPDGSIWLNGSRGTLGNVLRLEHRLPEAAEALREALAALPATATPTRASLLAVFAETALDQSDVDAAQRLAANSLSMARAVLPEHNVRLGASLFALARLKLAQSGPAEAESLLREALAVRHPPHPLDDPRIVEVNVALVQALGALGRKQEASVLRKGTEASLARLATPYAADLRARLAGDARR